jgi:ankyrin repeat protein
MASLSCTKQQNASALVHAAVWGHVEVVELLLNAGSQDKDLALRHAAERGRSAAVILLLHAGANLLSCDRVSAMGGCTLRFCYLHNHL